MRRSILIAATVIVSSAFSMTARADTVNPNLVGAGSNILANIYIGPYFAAKGGSLIDVVCDDFVADSYINESWTATVSTLADVSQTKFKDTTKYEEVAWLSQNLMSSSSTCPNPANCKADIQFAIWQVFDSTGSNQPFSLLSGNNLSNTP